MYSVGSMTYQIDSVFEFGEKNLLCAEVTKMFKNGSAFYDEFA